ENRGLILVTGPTGSGKTTTLASMISHINDNRPVHIVTIEDPIEVLHRDSLAEINQREVGSDTQDFLSALRAALRQDPDVILVGGYYGRVTFDQSLLRLIQQGWITVDSAMQAVSSQHDFVLAMQQAGMEVPSNLVRV